jgi:predicted transposase/invertase (TIGR01784 family)
LSERLNLLNDYPFVKVMGEKDIKNDPLHRWLAWLDQDSPQWLVEEAVRMDRAIQKAEERVAHIAGDKEALRAYEMRQMALSDWTSGINHARREGMKEGEKQKAIEIARNLKAIGIPLEQIVQITGLTENQIREL